MLADFPIYIDTSGSDQVKASVDNIELDRSAWSSFFSEDAVEELLWDLYDGTSTEGDLEVDVGLIQDNVALGFKPIYNAVTNGVRLARAFTTIYSFFSTLLPNVTPAVKADIVTLAKAEQIDIENANEFEQFAPNTIDNAFQVGIGTPGSATFDVEIGRLYTDVTVDWPAQATFGAGTPRAGEPLQANTQYDPDLVGNRFGDFVYFKFAIAAPGNYRVQVNPVAPSAGEGPFSYRLWLNKRRSAEFCDATSVDRCSRFQPGDPGAAVVIDTTFAAAPSVYTFAVAAYGANGKIVKANFTVQVTRQP
jgi:hypothetical protein